MIGKLLELISVLSDSTQIISFFQNFRKRFSIKRQQKRINLLSNDNDDWKKEKYYDNFIGRQKERNEYYTFFTSENLKNNSLVISAGGGAGKTAICRQVVEDLSKKDVFQIILWFTCKRQRYDANSETIKSNDFSTVDNKEDINLELYSSIVNRIFYKLNIPNPRALDIDEKELILKKFFNKQKILIILDGLDPEEIPDSNVIIDKFNSLISQQTKLFVTTRQYFEPYDNITSHKLDLLNPEESKIFLQKISKEKKTEEKINNLSRSETKNLIKACCGYPLLLKITASELRYLDYSRIFERITLSENDSLNEYLLLPAWEYLVNQNILAIEILKYLSFYEESENQTLLYEYFIDKEIAKNKLEIDKSIKVLTDLSLLQKSYRKYTLHSFIQSFVKKQNVE